MQYILHYIYNVIISPFRGYPTIKYFAAGVKSSPVDYDGGRTASDIVAWGLSKVVVHIDPPKIIEVCKG